MYIYLVVYLNFYTIKTHLRQFDTFSFSIEIIFVLLVYLSVIDRFDFKIMKEKNYNFIKIIFQKHFFKKIIN